MYQAHKQAVIACCLKTRFNLRTRKTYVLGDLFLWFLLIYPFFISMQHPLHLIAADNRKVSKKAAEAKIFPKKASTWEVQGNLLKGGKLLCKECCGICMEEGKVREGEDCLGMRALMESLKRNVYLGVDCVCTRGIFCNLLPRELHHGNLSRCMLVRTCKA